MQIIWHKTARNDYLLFQKRDVKMLERINVLIQSIADDPYNGIGKPEPLKGNLSGWWSRRIDRYNRLVYRISGEEIEIAQCKGHYNDK